MFTLHIRSPAVNHHQEDQVVSHHHYHTLWCSTVHRAKIYLLKSTHDALSSFQMFAHSVVNPNGFRVERLRADKGGEFTSKKLKNECLQTGVLLEFSSTNTPQQTGMSERVGKILAAMVRCMLADSGLPTMLWGELMLTAAFLGNRAPHSAIGMQSPYKLLHGTGPDLRLLRVIGARAFVHIERHSQSSNSRRWEDDWWDIATTARATTSTIH